MLTSLEQNFRNYDPGHFFDEMFESFQRPRPGSRVLLDKLDSLSFQEIQAMQAAAIQSFFDQGITFAVYGEGQGSERIFPFDIVPRIIEGQEWVGLEQGLKQRIHALNLFLDDIYHNQKILRDKIIPRDVIETSAGYNPKCQGLNPPQGIWCHISGTDLVRDENGKFMVLEDNLRAPSGVSYVLANRQVMKNIFPSAFSEARVRPVENYPSLLLDMLYSVAPSRDVTPNVALLTPGIYNAAFFEHTYLAQQAGMALVEGADLVVWDGYVHMRTTQGLVRVDVIYRRIDDDFLDPLCFREDSLLGVPGIMEAYRNSRVAIANAPGTGVADDKVVYAYVPEIIRYYLGQDPIIPNVPTYLCREPKQMHHVISNLEHFVVKPAHESGGYGMLVGPDSTREERENFAARIQNNPRNYIAQPVVSLSRSPVIVNDRFEGRHVDLRPYILYGQDIQVMPGGLTRVALKENSLVVNSSQGGGSKDTWVLCE